jgi:GntR family transcriptional regulator, phosphonate transport system regulatory protein
MFSAELEEAPQRASVWAQIAVHLTEGIVNGEHGPGTRLPTEHSLATRFGVNRHTVRRALSSLASQGLVRMVQGSGTYVETFAVDLVIGRRTRHSLSLQQAGVPGSLRLLDAAQVRASAEVAAALELAPRRRVLRLAVLGEAKNRPLHVGERYFPLPRFEGLDRKLKESGSITQAFAALGVNDYLRRESRVTAVLPSAEVAAALSQPVSRPVLQVRAVNVDTDGVAVEFATTFFAGDRVTLVVQPDA